MLQSTKSIYLISSGCPGVPIVCGSMENGSMKNKRIPLEGGDEYDALTKSRKYHNFGKGVLRKIKRQYNKRFRKIGKDETTNETL